MPECPEFLKLSPFMAGSQLLLVDWLIDQVNDAGYPCEIANPKL